MRLLFLLAKEERLAAGAACRRPRNEILPAVVGTEVMLGCLTADVWK